MKEEIFSQMQGTPVFKPSLSRCYHPQAVSLYPSPSTILYERRICV